MEFPEEAKLETESTSVMAGARSRDPPAWAMWTLWHHGKVLELYIVVIDRQVCRFTEIHEIYNG